MKLNKYIELRKKQIAEFQELYERRCENSCICYSYDDDMSEADWLEQEMDALP